MQSCLNTKMYTLQPTNLKKNTKKPIEIRGNSKNLTLQFHTVFFIETHTVYWEFTSTNPFWDKGFICLSNEENDLYGTKTRVTIRRKDPWADLEGGVTTPMGKENMHRTPSPRQTHTGISFGPPSPRWKIFLDPRMRSKRFPRSNARWNIWIVINHTCIIFNIIIW